ncbi:MAG: hypothetical protein K8T10_19780 [Candidatus Eremiobacteraeota bacterium]|nr:hypothetical protein [Candidatus Eremiobacteraeota bacterium]
MNNLITFFILAGSKKITSEPDGWVKKTREAMVFDLLGKLNSIETIDRVIISSNDDDFLDAVTVNGSDSRIIPDKYHSTNSFNFGKWLNDRILKYNPKNVFYWGAGASPFITRELLASFCASISAGKNILYTNNFFSADWVAFTPAEASLEITPPPMDNNLAYYLWQDRALRSIYIAPSVEIIGDVDTPADLLVLKVHPNTPPHTADYLKTLDIDTTRIKKFISFLPERNKIFLSGRVGSSLFKYLDTRSPCKYRIISEERGMRSSGRLQRREVRSFLGEMIEEVGLDTVFKFIEETSKGAVIDSRVIFAHICKKVSTKDRFYSDLGIPGKIEDPFVKEFTKRVVNSPIPILAGGHSLILGGLWALVSAFGELPAFY